MDNIWSDALKFVHGTVFVLFFDLHFSILNHETKMVESNPDYQNWDIVSDWACLKQINREIEDVVILSWV